MKPLVICHFSELSIQQHEQELLDFWQQGQHGFIRAEDQRSLAYSQFIQPQARAELVISPGRIEAKDKYMELCFDLFQAGFNLHLIDHRGQGRSERLTRDPHLGYVGNFADYVTDLALFIEQKVQPLAQAPVLALAHSMGAAILCRYLQSRPDSPVQAAVYCSPMFGIAAAGLPRPVTLALARLLVRWQGPEHYFPGQQPYREKEFADNTLCSSQGRYQWFRRLYRQYPELQLGGVSNQWLLQALQACVQLQQTSAPELPQLILQAETDSVVDNKAQLQFARHRPQLTLHTIANAKHELLLETDTIRQQVYQHLNLFWQRLGI